MNIKLIINRTKKDNEIHELFSVQPDNYLCYDSKRKIFHMLREQRNINSIHKYGYALKNIEYLGKSILYVYDYDADRKVPSLYEEINIEYFPFLGKKKCKKCLYNKGKWCLMKGKEINKHSYYKCFYWTEK
jgi:hypothetical protein